MISIITALVAMLSTLVRFYFTNRKNTTTEYQVILFIQKKTIVK